MVLLSFLLDVLIIVLSAIGVAGHFRIFGWPMFQYYTLDSNLFLLLACAVQARYEGAILLGKRLFVPSWVRVLKYLAVCTVMVTLFVVLFVLIPLYGGWSAVPWLLFQGTSPYHHLLCPLLGAASFILLDRPGLGDRRLTLWALGPTAFYAVVAIVLNLLRLLRGPYPFLLVYDQPVYMSLFWCVLILGLAWALAWAVWKLALRFSEPREPSSSLPEEAGWTGDGFIKDQDALSRYTYRTIPASENGCGPVAAFDLRRFDGQEPRFDEVLREMDGLHLLRVPGPTYMRAMRRYLNRYLPGFHEIQGREDCLAAAGKSRMGLYRYLEERVPHFVSYIRVEDGRFRFFNVSDGTEDRILSMEEFGRGHLCGGPVRLLWWD